MRRLQRDALLDRRGGELAGGRRLGGELERKGVDLGEAGEDLDDLRVELAAGIASDLVNSEIDGQGRLISPLRGHGVECIGDQDDAAQDRDGIAGEPEWVPATVETLMVVEDRLGDLGVETIASHGETQFGVTLHQFTFGLVQRPGLAQDPRIHVDLSDVVQYPGEGQPVEIVITEGEATSQVDGEVGDAVHVAVEVLDHVLHHLDEVLVWKVLHAKHN